MSAGGPRLLLQSLSIAPLHFLADVHLAGGSRHVPISVDTHRWAHCVFQTSQSTHGPLCLPDQSEYTRRTAGIMH